MHSATKIGLVAALGVTVIGGIAYWEGTTWSRVAKKGAHAALTDKEWTLLTEHIEEPSLQGAIAFELSAASGADNCKDSFKRADDHVGTILVRQKTSDDVSLAAIAHMMTRCNEPKLLTWTSRPPSDVVRALHAREIAGLCFAPPNVLADLLLRLKPAVDQNLVDVVLATTKPTPSSVDAFFTSGFPANGADFATGAAVASPATDPRLSQGIAQWLWSLQDDGFGIQPEAAASMLRILDHVTPPRLDEKMARCLGAADGKDAVAMKLCGRIATPADKDLVTRLFVNPKDRDACTSALGDSTGDALMNKDAALRKAAEKDLAARDRHRFAVAIAKSFRAGVANASDAADVEKLLADPPLEVDAWLSLLSLGDDKITKDVVAYLGKTPKPEDWVPDLFVGLANKPNAAELAGDARLLKEVEGTAPIAGAILAHALVVAGSPEKVDDVTKRLALETLEAKGTAKDAPTIEPFVTDGGGDALAARALAAVKGR